MLVLAMIALGGGACFIWDRIADPDFNRNWGWLVKTGLVIAAIALVLGPLGEAVERLNDAIMVVLGYVGELIGFLLMAILVVGVLLGLFQSLKRKGA